MAGDIWDPAGFGRNKDGSIPIGRTPNTGPNGSATLGDEFSKAGDVLGQTWDNLGRNLGNLWNDISGAYHPNEVTFNQNAGQFAGQSQGPDGRPQGQVRDMQMSLIQQLQDQAAGRGPSLAQMQLQQGTDRNIAQAMALGQSMRGAGQAGMLKGIQGQQAGIAQGMAGDAALLRLQEQMQARQMLGQTLGGARGQDQSFANMGMQNNQFNAGLGEGNAQRAQQAAIEQAKLDMEREKMLGQERKDKSPLGAIGGLLAAFSDENLKTEVTPGGHKLYDFLDKLDAHEYKYKDSKHGSGRRISPMAQELEKSDLGEEFVFETKAGKAVDYGKGFGTMLASQAELHRRLKKLEGK